MTRLPLRRGLLWGMVALTAAGLVVAGVTSAFALRSYLLQRTDEQLHLAGAVAQQRVTALEGLEAGDAQLKAVIAPSEYAVELRRSNGDLIRVSGPDWLATGALLAQAPPPPADGRVSAPVTVLSGAYRVVAAQAPDAVVVVGLPLAPVRQTVARLALVETVSGATVLALLACFAWLLLVRGLRPLEEITATATAIAEGDLDRRVPVSSDGRTEVGRLTLAVNGMLARIQSALAARARSERRLRDFVADASHELRTPLTSIRGYLQLLRQGIVTVHERPDVLRRTDEEATRMAAIVDDLLYLARLDAEPALRREPVDLTTVVRDCVADSLAVQPGRRTELSLPESCPVRGDVDALHQVMANLLANVAAHTPPGTPVAVRLTRVDGTARVEVADEGPGMPPEIAGRAFDRFTRGDTGRGHGGSGLGLAIVAEIVAAHGGGVSLDSRPGAGTTVAFTMPTADS
jgi:two-component system OmpR family sensor kinase